MSSDKLPSISASIDEQSRKQIHRHSLQPKSQIVPVHPIRRYKSFEKDRLTSSIQQPSIPVIPEVEKSDDEGMEINNSNNLAPQTTDPVRVSFTKQTRKVSNISRTSRKSSVQSQINNNERGFVNYGYDRSTVSSLQGSMSSLPVIREQYCCCSRWTKLERNLAIIVAILALIIICLVITIGFVAKTEGNSTFGSGFSLIKF